MSREIKFRAWRTDEKYMVTSDTGVLTALRNCYGNKGLAEQARFSNIDNQPNPNKFILMQYTGLKDKNGKEIYEGDIATTFQLKEDYKTHEQIKHIVIFGEYLTHTNYYTESGVWTEPQQHQGFYLKNIESDIMQEIGMFVLDVIGNIYENPELLK